MSENQSAKSPNALEDLGAPQSGKPMPSGFEPGQGYRPAREAASAPKAGADPARGKVGILVSVLLHALAVVFLFMSALMAPKRPSTVPVFEIVNLEKPKLRPLTPKTVKPPEPPPPEPEPVKPPEAPKLTPKPTQAVNTRKPEPKVVKEKEPEPEPKPVKEVVQEQQVLEPVLQTNAPSDPRLSFWASRVKKKVDLLWNPPTGIDILGTVKAVVNFTVARDGSVVASSIAESSGNSQLDELALMVIKRLEGIPPIPENFPNDQLEVRCEFPYSGQ